MATAPTAPYNFVPPAPDPLDVSAGYSVGDETLMPWVMHDRWHPRLMSGRIDFEACALTPVYVKGPERADRDEGPYLTRDGRAVLPGSSLRGMVRSLVEIIARAPLAPINDKPGFFRDFSKEYEARVNEETVRVGLVRSTAAGWAIQPGEHLRVSHDQLKKRRMLSPGAAAVWIQRDAGRVTDIRPTNPGQEGDWLEATLLVTGEMKNKKREHVVVADANEDLIPIRDADWELFHSAEQITAHQEKFFPARKDAARRADGHLGDGDPVFFIGQEDRPLWFGRSRLMRLPEELSPADLRPKGHSDQSLLSLPDALFGRVAASHDAKGGPPPSVRGRLRFLDAVSPEQIDPAEIAKVTALLASPKSSYAPHYLRATDGSGKPGYMEGDRASSGVRGHKLYWHRPHPDGPAALLNHLRGGESTNDRMDSTLEPVPAGTTWKGALHFENLAPAELGALWAALDLPAGHAHRIGGGQPLGLGSIRITPEVQIVDRSARGRSWEDDGYRPASDQELRAAVVAFSELPDGKTPNPESSDAPLRALARDDERLRDLLQLLMFDEAHRREKTEAMELSSFKDREPLPRPDQMVPPPPPRPPQKPEVEKGDTVRVRATGETSKKGNPKVDLVDHLRPDGTPFGGIVEGMDRPPTAGQEFEAVIVDVGANPRLRPKA
jgi:CRISPR-associated protein (TIGR03986 family)